MHDAVAADESARALELIRDPREDTTQAPDAMPDRELREPQGRGPGSAAAARATAGELEGQTVDLFENQPAVDVGDAIVVVAFDPVGVGDADARSMAQAVLGAQNVEDRIIRTARRCELLVDRGHEP